jgi:hypothetical protein
MLLSENLNSLTRAQLLDMARDLLLSKCSQLRKAPLVERIKEAFCTEETLRARLTCLTNEQLALFRKACRAPQLVSPHQVADAIQMESFSFGYYDDDEARFFAFEEVAEIFKKIDDKAFAQEQSKKGWLMKCMRFFALYYGIAPVEILYKLYKSKVKSTPEEMLDLLWSIPMDMVDCLFFTMEQLGMENCPKSNPLYSSIGLLIYTPLFEENSPGALLDEQADKPFYIPSAQQIEEIYKFAYEASAPAYKKLEAFLRQKKHLSYADAVSWCLQVWAISYQANSLHELLDQLADAGMLENDTALDEWVDVLVAAHNQTRMIENRGHTPMELAPKPFMGALPTLVPGNSSSAALLREMYRN